MFQAFVVCLILLLSTSSKVLSQVFSAQDSTLTGIKTLYDDGSYIEAELQARRVLEDRTVNDSLRVQLEKYLAFSLVAQGKNNSATEHFLNALKIDSTLELDPVLTSPKILAVFEKAKEEFRGEEQGKLPGQEANGDAEQDAAIRGAPTFRTILFPGWDQFHSGKKKKGLILLSAGALTALSAVSFTYLKSTTEKSYLDAPTPALAASRYKDYNFCYKAQIYSVGAFVVVYLYSEIDSFVDLPPHFSIDYMPQRKGGMIDIHLSF